LRTKKQLNLTIKPVSRPKGISGFVLLPCRWGQRAHQRRGLPRIESRLCRTWLCPCQ
ncbi:hypothetical protein GTX14_07035, partial [Streptomyces sp. SID4944]|nr:hypothetical protein [Streptomyces sp. SID4944]